MTTSDLMKWVSVRVGDPLYERIKAAAEADQRSISNWIGYELARILDEREGKTTPPPERDRD
jgi:predicted HicB family RNase H-like nuclease